MSPIISIRATPFELVMDALSENQDVLLTHLVVWLLTLMAGVFLALRFFTIWYKNLLLVADDALLMASWTIVFFYSVLASVELALGVGRKSTSSPAAGPSAILLLDNVARTLALIAVAWSKSALALSFLGTRRGGETNPVRWGLRALVGLLNVLVLGVVIVHWVRCRPVFKAWDAGVDGVCFGRAVDDDVQIAAQAYFAFMDLTLIVVGVWLVSAENLTRYEQAGVGLVTLLGLITSTASILTAFEIFTLTDADFIDANIRVLLAASLEAPLTILITTLPALRFLLPSPSTSLSSKLRQSVRIIRNRDSAPLTMGMGGRGGVLGTGAVGTSSPFAGFRPIRPARPPSMRSFLTDEGSLAAKRSGGGGYVPPSTATTLQGDNNNNVATYNNNNNNNTAYNPAPYGGGGTNNTGANTAYNNRPYTPGQKRITPTGSTDDLLSSPSSIQPPFGLDYDFARWNTSPSFPAFTQQAQQQQQQDNRGGFNQNTGTVAQTNTTASRGGVFASALPPVGAMARKPSNAGSFDSMGSGVCACCQQATGPGQQQHQQGGQAGQGHHQQHHPRQKTPPSNIATGPYRPRQQVTPFDIPSNPYMTTTQDSPTSASANNPYTRALQNNSFTNTSYNNAASSYYYNAPNNNINPNRPASPPGVPGSVKRLTSVREESAPSWASSAVRSEDRSDSIFDMYGSLGGGGASTTGGRSSRMNRDNRTNNGLQQSRSRDSPTLGQWGSWGKPRDVTPVKPLQPQSKPWQLLGTQQQKTGQTQGANGYGGWGDWTQGAKGWTQRVLGVQI